jgi:hypothetical protein
MLSQDVCPWRTLLDEPTRCHCCLNRSVYSIRLSSLDKISSDLARLSRASPREATIVLRDRISPHLPHAFLSTAPSDGLLHHSCASTPPRRAPPWPHSRCRHATRGHTYPIAAVASTAGIARLGHRTHPIAGAAGRSSGATQPPAHCHLLHRDHTTRFHCVVLRLPASQVLLKAHVVSVCFKCFKYFKCMLQVFQMDVVKIDRDVTYVAMIVHLCCKGLLPMFSSVFWDVCCKCIYLDVAYVSHICCKCFI